MNKILLTAYALIASCWVSFGQTNAPAAAQPAPRPALKLPAAPQQTSPDVLLPANTNSPAGQMNSEDTGAATGLNALAERMKLKGNPAKTAASSLMAQEGLLQAAGPASSSDFDRNMAAAFKPEIIRAGHTQIYSSVVTAVARKNPLCLLDPTFLKISF
jgi:hypothetical protein